MPTALETTTAKIVRRLEADGWTINHGARHDKFTHPARTITIVVPRHRTLSNGVARQIARGAGWI